MTSLFRCLALFARVLAGGARRASQLRAGARVMLVAALLAPLTIVTPNDVPSVSSQVANTRQEISARSTSAGGSGRVELPPNNPQSSEPWTALPNNGLGVFNSRVDAFVWCAGQLYVGGQFQMTGDHAVQDLNNIARFNTTNHTWSALPHKGLYQIVHALACHGSDLYVGGVFDQTADGALTGLGGIAKFNTTTNTWSALPHNGLIGSCACDVLALAVSGNDLYVGGAFFQTTDGAVTDLNYIAKFSTSGNTWSALPHKGLDFVVAALAISGSDLYVGGAFANTSDATVTGMGNIAKFSTTGNTWSALSNTGLSGYVYSLAFNGGDLYVGGTFATSGDGAVTNLNNIARFSTTGHNWSALPNHGLNGKVSTLAFNGGDLYVGGTNFTKTTDSAVLNLNYIAKLSTTSNTWSALPDNGLNNQVHALLFIGGDLYVGGPFTHTFNRPANITAPEQAVLTSVALFLATASCGSVTGNVALQQITCAGAGGPLTIAATQAQFADSDVAINVTEMVSCGAQTITGVRVLTPDGTNPPLSGPIGATAGIFAGSVPLLGASGPVDLKIYCSGSATPLSIVILTVVTVVLPPSGTVGIGSLSVNLASANFRNVQVVLYYKDPTLGDVIWNANAYNQLNPQITTSGASGQFGWNVPGGQYFVKVSGPCYQSAQSSVVSVPPAITNLNITLQPVANCTTISLPLILR